MSHYQVPPWADVHSLVWPLKATTYENNPGAIDSPQSWLPMGCGACGGTYAAGETMSGRKRRARRARRAARKGGGSNVVNAVGGVVDTVSSFFGGASNEAAPATSEAAYSSSLEPIGPDTTTMVLYGVAALAGGYAIYKFAKGRKR